MQLKSKYFLFLIGLIAPVLLFSQPVNRKEKFDLSKELNIPIGARKVTLPSNRNINIFSMTVAESGNDEGKALQPLYDYFDDVKEIELREGNSSVSSL